MHFSNAFKNEITTCLSNTVKLKVMVHFCCSSRGEIIHDFRLAHFPAVVTSTHKLAVYVFVLLVGFVSSHKIGKLCNFILLDFSLTVKAAPHEYVIRTSQPWA